MRLITLSVASVILVACQARIFNQLGDDDQPGPEPSDLKSAKSSELKLKRACEAGKKVHISAVGDVLLHTPLQVQGYKNKDFKTLWADLLPYLAESDLSYANFEGPGAGDFLVEDTKMAVAQGGKSIKDPGLTFDDKAYTSYPQFNYHPQVISDLKTSGFDVLSTANNHSLDRRNLGVEYTISAMKNRQMPFTGTRLDANDPWHTVTESNGLNIAWLACTFSTNGIPNKMNRVLMCYTDEGGRAANPEVLSEIKKLSQSFDAVIVTPHWGVEYQHTPSQSQRNLAKEFAESGATAVIGAHPHVLQPWDVIKTADNREVFVFYSLGNFVSGQIGPAKRTSAALFFSLTKSNSGGKAFVSEAKYLPLWMDVGNGQRQVKVLDFEKATVKAEFPEVLKIVEQLYPGSQARMKAKPAAIKVTEGCGG